MSDHESAVLDATLVSSTWNGSPTQLQVNQGVTMPQTPNGTMIFAATNQATQNNAGTIVLTSGGGVPKTLNIPALSNTPVISIDNWNANNLNASNTSANNNTPILVQGVGPGIPGITPASLSNTPTSLTAGQCAQANVSPQWMQLVLQVTGATLGIVGFIGGPQDASGNNGYVIQLNAANNTGPDTGVAPPAGYYATTTSNTYTYQFNWGDSGLIFVANLSPSTGLAVAATLRAL